MGGSTNTVLHTLAIAREAGVDYEIDRINEVAERVPNICKVSPSSSVSRRGCGPGRRHQRDPEGAVQAAGHPPRRRDDRHRQDARREHRRARRARIRRCIRPLSNPYSERGGWRSCSATSRRRARVVKAAGVLPEMMRHRGPAVIFDSQEEADAGILNGKVKAGDVVVIRYEGPKGGPGMQEMLAPTSNIMGMGLGDVGRADHRRPVQRRHARRVHRPRLARGGRRRPHRPAPRRRHDHDRHPGAAAGGRGVGRGVRAPPGRVAAGAARAVGLAETLRGDGPQMCLRYSSSM